MISDEHSDGMWQWSTNEKSMIRLMLKHFVQFFSFYTL